MKLISIFCALCVSAFIGVSQSSFTLSWTPPTNEPVSGYIVYAGMSPYQYSVPWPVTNTDNCVIPWVPWGVNYYSVVAFESSNGIMSCSSFSEAIAVTNRPGFVLQNITLTSTNANGGWSPIYTNNSPFFIGSNNRQFLRDYVGLFNTNQLGLPPLPPTNSP